ncbi:adhesion G protein-coupled receptor E4-like, partial [Leucoraja erinacea]|uniref:adhesion G protein-coupled receptor E4-like n=1 Tax=Leucoraja erinaceus TaxID=7782 RepID=UPI0024583754
MVHCWVEVLTLSLYITRIRTFKTMAQFVVLGCSWVIGLFQLNKDTIVLSYIFTIVNGSQGVFIFLVHCLLNQQVRREYSNWFNRMCRKKKTEAADTSCPIAISQVMVSADDQARMVHCRSEPQPAAVACAALVPPLQCSNTPL